MSLPTNQILHGDCLELLKTLPSESLDSVVTDPPYGLGTDHPTPEEMLAYLNGAELAPVKKGVIHCLKHILDASVISDSYDRDAQIGEEGISFRISVSNSPMGFWSVQLKDELQTGEEEINDKRTNLSLEDMLMSEAQIERTEPLSCGNFCLRVRQGSARCVGVCGCFSDSGQSIFSVAVRLGDDSQTKPFPSTFEVAVKATECAAVLTLDVRTRTGNLSFTKSTDDCNPTILLLPSQRVGANPGAGGLPSMLQSLFTSQVRSTTDRAFTFNLNLTLAVVHRLQNPNLPSKDFMGKPWDLPSVAIWKECFRVLKPGGYLLAFAGTRTFDIMSMGIRMAGFENRDTVAAQFGPSVMQWQNGQGFPKSLNVSKAIDRKLGATRKVVGTKKGVGGENLNDIVNGREVRQTTEDGGKGVGAYGVGAKQVAIDIDVTEPGSEEAKKWDGYGTALKPAWEPIIMFRKPLSEKSVADQILKTGTGAINIDACRVGGGEERKIDNYTSTGSQGCIAHPDYGSHAGEKYTSRTVTHGRWPANLILVHAEGCKVIGTKKVKAPVINRFDDGMKPFGEGAGHEFTSTPTGDANGQEDVAVFECVEGCPAKVLDEQSGFLKGGMSTTSCVERPEGKESTTYSGKDFMGKKLSGPHHGDSGGASRFFAQFEQEETTYDCAEGCPIKELDEQSGELKTNAGQIKEGMASMGYHGGNGSTRTVVADTGGASRFFAQFDPDASFIYQAKAGPAEKRLDTEVEAHPTVKPVALMRYLVRLVTPPGGIVLDPYVGSGTTAVAAVLEGVQFIGMDKHEPYVQRARLRVEKALRGEEPLPKAKVLSKVVLEPSEVKRIEELVENPPPPSEQLVAAFQRVRKPKYALPTAEDSFLLDLALSDD